MSSSISPEVWIDPRVGLSYGGKSLSNRVVPNYLKHTETIRKETLRAVNGRGEDIDYRSLIPLLEVIILFSPGGQM